MNTSRYNTKNETRGTRPGVVINPMTHYKTKSVRWLEEGRIAMGKLTLIAGDPGLGKSFMTLELAARISRGEVGRRENMLTGRTVIMSAEDDAGDTLVPRLNAMCARMSYVHFLEGMRSASNDMIDLPQLDRDTDLLIEAIEAIGDVSLVVIDPISAYMGRADSHNNAEVRSVLAQLARLAQVTGAAVVCVTHLNKDSSGKRAVYRAMGSLAFTAAARTVHLVTKHPKRDDDPHTDVKRVVSMVKNNLGPIMPARVYVINEGILTWLDEELAVDADALDGAGGDIPMVDQAPLIDQAVTLLQDELRHGERSAGELIVIANERKIGTTTLTEARKVLCVTTRKIAGGWAWSLPAHERDFEHPQAENPSGEHCEILYDSQFDVPLDKREFE